MARQSASDEFVQGFGNAVADIREKFEESVYGRAVTERGGDAPQWPEAREPEPSFGSSTHTRDVEPEREQSQDIDLDR
jgi:hypothetical protein